MPPQQLVIFFNTDCILNYYIIHIFIVIIRADIILIFTIKYINETYIITLII